MEILAFTMIATQVDVGTLMIMILLHLRHAALAKMMALRMKTRKINAKMICL